MILPFSKPHEGARDISKISQTIPSFINIFILIIPALSQHGTGCKDLPISHKNLDRPVFLPGLKG
jgi:hypothetical protein